MKTRSNPSSRRRSPATRKTSCAAPRGLRSSTLFMSLQIHWHEGLFLQPHHLQRLQKNVFDLVAHERALTWSYPYGVVDIRLVQDDLENQRIRFDRLRAVMPSGLEIDFPRNADV